MAPQESPDNSKLRNWALPVVLLGVFLAMVAFLALRPPSERPTELLSLHPRTAEAPPAEPAELTIDFGEGEPLKIWLAVGEGTALNALQLACRQASVSEPELRGQGAMAFVTSVGGVPNEGAGGRNWVFEVNGELGVQSAAVTPVGPGDRVLWRFSEKE